MAPFNSLAQAAIGAAHQGVFDLDFRAGLLSLSAGSGPDGGPVGHETTLNRMATGWTHIHPEDREVYSKALEDYRQLPAWHSGWNSAPADAQVHEADRWLELRATIVSEQDVPSDCLGLISDITQRKEAEFAPCRRRKANASATPPCRATS